MLGYKNPTEFARPLDAQDKAKKSLGFGSPANAISKPGLFQLVLRTQRTHPVAREFQDWVTRVVEIDGEPWFVARDVYLVLFGRTTGINATATIAPDEKRVLMKVSAPDSLTHLFDKHQYRLALITESGFYKLVSRSDKPEAHEFQDWVTRVVLPAIRKDGGYIMGEEKVASWQGSTLVRQIRPYLVHLPCKSRQHRLALSVPIGRTPRRSPRDVQLG